MTTVLIDNYDSFTWNVYQYFSALGANVQVFRNDQTTVEHIESLNPRNLVISPGPGHPAQDAGISNEVISHFSGKIPILGICLGEQCMIETFGGKVSYAGEILHGKTSRIKHDGKGIFFNIPQDITVTRYHSLAGVPDTIPSTLEVTSWADGGIIMGIRHKEYTVEGVQFHPESVLSEQGKAIIGNFLQLNGGTWDLNTQLGILPSSQSSNLTNGKSVPVPPPTLTKSVPTILTKIHEQRLQDIETAKSTPGQTPTDLQKLLALHIAPPLIDFAARIKQSPSGVPAVFAEIKRASPSKGAIDLNANAAEQALAYAHAGASTISVLTEPKWFKGSLVDMRNVREVLANLPNRPAVLRKDFIVDTYQIMEARLYGADTVLLIVAMLNDKQLNELYHFARSLGMEPLVEVNNSDEMARAIALGAKVIGVNNRNLHNFNVDMSTTSRLAEMVPKGTVLAALSGISSRKDVTDYIQQGVGALLIGEALMRSKDKKAFIDELLGLTEEKTIKANGVANGDGKDENGTTVDDEVVLVEKEETKDGTTEKVDEVTVVTEEINNDKVAKENLTTDDTKQTKPVIVTTKALVKICGISTVEAALEAARAGADFIGLIFAKSRRQVSLDTAHEIIAAVRAENLSVPEAEPSPHPFPHDWFSIHKTLIQQVPRRPLVVGVFQNQPLQEIVSIATALNLDLIQLHGDESPDLCRFLPVPAIKAFHIDSTTFQPSQIPYITQPGYNAFVLLDTKVPHLEVQGGQGITFDWSIARKVVEQGLSTARPFPIILAGGLTPENVVDAVRQVEPWCVDVSSGVEDKEGKKDIEKIKDFVKHVKSVEIII